MKKTLALLVILVIAVSLLASCGEKPCEVHTYDNACDVDCNVCGETREASAHKYSNVCDITCDVCGAETEKEEHCGAPTQLVGGLSFINNDTVNLASGLVVFLLSFTVFLIV